MKPVINLYKPVGMTPLQAVDKFKEENRVYSGKKISYPGRLDPMAQGVLLLLVGDENKKMIKYMGLDKEYRAQILFGFSTDSHDILGLPEFNRGSVNERELKKLIKEFKGKYNQTIPAYSSYRIKGKALFSYARADKMKGIELPKKVVEIKDIKINSIHTITGNRLLREINRKIIKLKGDFRQEIILDKWRGLLEGKEKEKFVVLDVTIQCSSGTYIRAIADDLGKRLNCRGVLLDLIRIKLGRFDVKNSVRLKIN